MGTFPYLPNGIGQVRPVTHDLLSFGGSRVADEAARRDGWPRVLAFLNGLP